MELPSLLLLGVVVVAIVMARRQPARADRIDRVDRPSRLRIENRLIQIQDPDYQGEPEVVAPGPRRRLWRDTSAALFLFGAGLLVILAVVGPARPAGAVLGATSAPNLATTQPDRLASLTACPDRPDCYIYVVRGGDTLASIATAFGIPSTTLVALNPGIRDPAGPRTGDRIVLPTPQR